MYRSTVVARVLGRCLLAVTLLAPLAVPCAPAWSMAGRPAALPATSLEIITATGPRQFAVEVAADAQSQSIGLMHRRSLPLDRGMLFVFEGEEPRAFWMQNTYISLDMIFIRGDGRIVAIVENTTPFSETPIAPPEPAKAVLEVNAGTVERLQIRIGDAVRHPALVALPR